MTGRAPLDRYDTPPWAVQVLLHHVPELRGRRLFDPCCGDGSMSLTVAGGRFQQVLTNDIDSGAPSPFHWDLRRRALWEMAKACWCVTNPPFCLTGEVMQLSLAHCQGVALLLRLSALEVCKGRELLELYPPRRQIVLPRIRFRGRSTDQVTTAWFVWAPVGSELSGPPIVCVSKQHAQSFAERTAA